MLKALPEAFGALWNIAPKLVMSQQKLEIGNEKKENMLYKTLWFTGFAGPAAICFVLVMLIPFIYGMYLTLTDWNGISAEKVLWGLKIIKRFSGMGRSGILWC